MARVNYAVEKALRIYKENSDTDFIDILFGAGAPLGTSGETAEAAIGSLYTNSSNGDLYRKKTDTNSAADWDNTIQASIGNWRPERVDAHTGQVLAAGATNPTTWSDNDDGTAAAAFTIGHYVLDGNCNLWEITAISAPNITLAAATTAPAADDTFAVKYNMPDPAGQENQAIIVFDGAACIKVADIDWEFLSGISLSSGYSAGGPTETQATTTIAASSNAEVAVEILDDRTKVVSQTGVSTLVNLDVVLVDEVRSAVWLVSAFDEANPTRVKSAIVHAVNNGTSGADATAIDDAVFGNLKEGGNFNISVSLGLTSSGATQGMALNITSTEPNVTVTATRLGLTPSGY